MIPSAPPEESLLPGEAQWSELLEDAEHWTAVYEELTRFLLDTHPANSSMMGSFRLRLAYWRHRRDELTT